MFRFILSFDIAVFLSNLLLDVVVRFNPSDNTLVLFSSFPCDVVAGLYVSFRFNTSLGVTVRFNPSLNGVVGFNSFASVAFKFKLLIEINVLFRLLVVCSIEIDVFNTFVEFNLKSFSVDNVELVKFESIVVMFFAEIGFVVVEFIIKFVVEFVWVVTAVKFLSLIHI